MRVVLYENEAGGATLEYDKPSGREQDGELERALRRAAE
jgi:hypothetical protein